MISASASPSASSSILVTGATGTIGLHTVRALRDRGATVRAAARGAESSKELAAVGAVPTALVLGDTESVDAALEGVAALFLLTPFSEDSVHLGKHLVDRAKAKGLSRIVKLSAFGAEYEPGIQLGRWHREVEKHIEASGLPFTFLRPNNFMENFFNYYGPDKQGVIYLPWGDAKCSFIAGEDVGRVASLALLDEGHAGKAYTLTGPEALGIADAAKELSRVSGRNVTYVDVPEDAARAAMLGFGMPAFAVDGMMELHAIDKAGMAAVVTPTFSELTGNPGTTFAAFADAHAVRWRV